MLFFQRMYLTNKEFISQWTLLWGSETDLYSYVTVLLSLVKKYWTSSFSKDVAPVLGWISQELSDVCFGLQKIDKLNAKSLSALLYELHADEDASLSAKWPKADLIKEHVSWIDEVQESEKLELTLSSWWKIYKRWIDRDLDLLLN